MPPAYPAALLRRLVVVPLVWLLAAVTFLLTWIHSVLAGTDSGALLPLYLATGLPIVAGVAHRWWTVRVRPPP